jgi:hypothetical protein
VPIKDAAGNVVGHKQVKRLQPAKLPDGSPARAGHARRPRVQAAKSQLLASAALDMAYDGHLSRRNEKLLHARGIQLKPLGLVTYGEWLKKNRRTRAQATNPHGVPQAPEAAPGGAPGHI